MRKRFRNPFAEQEELSEVNITPLADISLTLLIMLMIISPMVLQSMIQVQAAQAVAVKEDRVAEKPVFVDVTRSGFTVNNKTFGTEYELFRALQGTLSRKRDKTVLISSAQDVRYQDVVRILDLVRQSGAASLSLVPRKKEA